MRKNQQLCCAILGVSALVAVSGAPIGEARASGSTMPRCSLAARCTEGTAALGTPVREGAQAPTQAELGELLDPEHTVLLVHEVLNAFVSEGGSFDARGDRVDVSGIMAPMVELLAAARANDVRVAYVRWTSYPDGSTYGRPPSSYDEDEPPSTISMHEGTWGWENPEEIKPEANDWVLRKYRPDAFIATALDELLRWNRLTTIVIVGIGAEIGVVPTMMTARSLGYSTVAIEDAIVPADLARTEDALLYIGDNATLLGYQDVIDIWNMR